MNRCETRRCFEMQLVRLVVSRVTAAELSADVVRSLHGIEWQSK